MGHIVRHRTPM